jgi:hypothetical protein
MQFRVWGVTGVPGHRHSRLSLPGRLLNALAGSRALDRLDLDRPSCPQCRLLVIQGGSRL